MPDVDVSVPMARKWCSVTIMTQLLCPLVTGHIYITTIDIYVCYICMYIFMLLHFYIYAANMKHEGVMVIRVAALTQATSHTTIGACTGLYLQYALGCAKARISRVKS
jgi:hypothetical protein